MLSVIKPFVSSNLVIIFRILLIFLHQRRWNIYPQKIADRCRPSWGPNLWIICRNSCKYWSGKYAVCILKRFTLYSKLCCSVPEHEFGNVSATIESSQFSHSTGWLHFIWRDEFTYFSEDNILLMYKIHFDILEERKIKLDHFCELSPSNLHCVWFCSRFYSFDVFHIEIDEEKSEISGPCYQGVCLPSKLNYFIPRRGKVKRNFASSKSSQMRE